ncbi:MAG: hypothetical protein J0L97_08360 [Alphaproteobacteria bacterium]|nr:hypothetical protein [Alphaproteobacteria bacterium]
MAFTRKRGRPRKVLAPRADRGTPELRLRHEAGVTAESLDMAFAKGVLTEDQHRAGTHFRWLHSVRYGVVGLRALDPLHYGGRELKRHDDAWMAEREAEYREAETALRGMGALGAVLEAAVIGGFGWRSGGAPLEKLREGLDWLDVWRGGLHDAARRKKESPKGASAPL